MPAWRRAIVALLLAAGTLAVFLPAAQNGFIAVDDGAYVTANPLVQRGLTADGLRWSLGASVSGHWHPVTLWSHMLDATLFGPNPRGHHLTSIVLHAINGALVFLLFHALTGAALRSAALAALWSLHPLRVESVAWVAERKDVLSGLFFLLTLLAWVRWTRTRRPAAYALSLALFACGLMAKSMLVTLPLVLLLLDVWPFRRIGRQTMSLAGLLPRLRETLPHFALGIVFSLLTIHFQGTAIASRANFPLLGRAAVAVLGALQYLRASFWPSGLAAMYPIPEVAPLDLVALAVLVLGAVTLFVLVLRRQAPFLAVGWCWFLGMLFPVLGLLQAGPQAWADRFSYLPALGLFLVVVWGCAEVAPSAVGARAAAIVGVLFATSLIAETVVTRRQIAFWRNDITLWRRAVAVTPPNYFAEVNLGAAWLRAGEAAAAVEHFRAAAGLAPRSLEAQAGYGEALRQTGRATEAVAPLRAAVQLAPGDPRPHASLAHALLDAGDREGAVAELRLAVALAPADTDLADLLNGLAVPQP